MNIAYRQQEYINWTVEKLEQEIYEISERLDKMEKENVHDEIVVNEGRKLHTVLTFQDFVIEEGKKGKHETKKSKPIKKRDEFVEDMEDDFIDPNDNPERFIKLREQFIEEFIE